MRNARRARGLHFRHRCSPTVRPAPARRTQWRVISLPTTRRASSRALSRCPGPCSTNSYTNPLTSLRHAQAIFDRLGDARYIQSSVSASYLEIYNEELSDLLTDASSEGHSHKTTFGQTSNKNGASLMLVEDIGTKKAPGKGVFVKNLSEHEVKSTSDVLQLIQLAQERRRVGETKMNKHSSRSHCVFTLTVSSKRPTNDGGTMECSGKLNLVDLAGKRERISFSSSRPRDKTHSPLSQARSAPSRRARTRRTLIATESARTSTRACSRSAG